eukprot:RCo032883
MIGNTVTAAGTGFDPLYAPMMTCDPLGTSMISNPGLGLGMGGCCPAPVATVAKPGLMARLFAGFDAALLRRPNMCKGIAAAAAFFWLVVWVISIISTSIPDWWWWLDSTSGV